MQHIARSCFDLQIIDKLMPSSRLWLSSCWVYGEKDALHTCSVDVTDVTYKKFMMCGLSLSSLLPNYIFYFTEISWVTQS